MAGLKSKLKMLAQRQLRYANNLMSVNTEINNLLEKEGIITENLNCIFLLTEPQILYDHLIEIADNYQNKKTFRLNIQQNKIDEIKLNVKGW